MKPAPVAGGQGAAGRPLDLDDDALLDIVQRQTLRYFWDFGHPVSGLARERSSPAFGYGPEVVTTGGSGFGVMAIVVGAERGWIARQEAAGRLLQIARFLLKADSYHGVLPHFLHGGTGRTVPFSRKDDGGDLVETAFLIAGLLCARQYFQRDDAEERQLRDLINRLWLEVEWSWHTRDGSDVLYWHWSPNNGWSMNHEIRGWDEALMTYVLAAASPSYPIDAARLPSGMGAGPELQERSAILRHHATAGSRAMAARCSSPTTRFSASIPRGLKDRYADYWQQNVSHVMINREHCVRNPNRFKGYGADCWGLTASDDPDGYRSHAPDNDFGVIAPTAAIASLPYAPEHSMRALRHFYFELGDRIWGDYGFKDAFDLTRDWYASSYLAIDQGPIIGMIENHRTGLLWNLFMSCPEVRAGLRTLGFESPHLGAEV